MLTLKNIRSFSVLIIVTIWSFFVVSCERLQLVYKDTNYAELGLTFDWQKCNGFIPKVSTVLFYEDQSESPIVTYVMGDHSTIKLKPGIYSVIAFNGRINEFSRLNINNLNSYFDINGTAISASNYSSLGFPLLMNPDSLVVASMEHLEVTEEMIAESFLASESKDCSEEPSVVYELLIQPLPTNVSCNLYVKVDRLHLVRSDGISIKLSGITKGVRLHNRINVPDKGAIEFNARKIIDNTNVNGYIFGKSFVFGIPEKSFYSDTTDEPTIVCQKISISKSMPNKIYVPESELSLPLGSLMLDVELTLRDVQRTVVKRQFDVSLYTTVKKELFGEIIIEINLTTDPDNKIVIPEIVPEDEPGLTPNIGDWGDEDIIDIPLASTSKIIKPIINFKPVTYEQEVFYLNFRGIISKLC